MPLDTKLLRLVSIDTLISMERNIRKLQETYFPESNDVNYSQDKLAYKIGDKNDNREIETRD